MTSAAGSLYFHSPCFDGIVSAEKYAHARELFDLGLDRFKRGAHVEADGIVAFDVDTTDALVSRYAPYLFFPNARYSVGITRREGTAKLTAMRSPWLEFASAPLGRIAQSLGGGGHQRVGSITLRGDTTARARAILGEFMRRLRESDRSIGGR